MNVFEDLVVELKEENLLEDTFLDALGENAASGSPTLPEQIDVSIPPPSALADDVPDVPVPQFEPARRIDDDAPESADLQLMGSDETIEFRRATSEKEFFKKRANGEVLSMQMVEHVISAIEREQLKMVPRSFDELDVKKALHSFLQVAEDTTTDAHKQSEFALMQEIESWCSALAIRDKDVSVSALRRYCETCRPKLSSQAMLALARFYRNLPYSEPVRGKFDYIITRLFSRGVNDETRKLLFSEAEMLGHIKTLYADWSSIPLYTADDESKIQLAAASFKELSLEAQTAERFDDLIKSDFFNRIRLFKESIAEIFYAPMVTVAAIECNIHVGNVFVQLIDRERMSAGAASTHDKYGFIDDQAVSEATGRTLELTGLLRQLTDREESFEDYEEEVEPVEDAEPVNVVKEETRSTFTYSESAPGLGTKLSKGVFGINIWLLIGGFVLIGVSVGLWVWANYYVGDEQASTSNVRTVQIDQKYRDNIKVARLSGDILFVVLQPTWETMTKERREELLKGIYQEGAQGGWTSVELMNSQGKTVGFASPTKFDVDQ